MANGDPRNTADELTHAEPKPRKPTNLELLIALDIHEFYAMDPHVVAKVLGLLDTVRAVAINSLSQRGYALAYEVQKNEHPIG